MRSLLSRLAREIKVVRVSGIVSGLRGCGLRRSPGSAELRRAAFPPRKKFGAVARAEFLPPYSRAAATVFHRLPGTESAAIVAERCASWHGLEIALLRVNELAVRPERRAPRNKI
jgi:hypothetical protein